ncbi:MAG: hypothetical protein DRQ88_01995 [Epsilonproteobacteria bacterium]|nr:MAG: hypothetical protein DRQ89_00740 [Campylobacterota bacterium]RLA67635.1 MAG: hypothetical protein DRQ88_01995 [Campylobacterota bacterium]
MKNDKKLSFILYQEEKTPQIFEIKKNILKFLIIAFPIMAFLFLATIVTGTLYFRKIKTFAEKQESQILKELKVKNALFLKKEKEYKKVAEKLQNKLAAAPATGLGTLSLFKTSNGQIDQTKKSPIVLDSIRTKKLGTKVQLNFNLKNERENGAKIAGYLFIITKSGNNLRVYPKNSISNNEYQIAFNKGESFGFSRFRPVRATFPLPKGLKSMSYKILVFSRVGDLIFQKFITQKIRN